MSESRPTPASAAKPFSLAKFIAIKSLVMILICAALGLAQYWATPGSYSPAPTADFRLGLLHGSLLPAAFPALLLGKDVPIYTAASAGQRYKLGYICGLNLSGMIFFGFAYWRPPQAQNKPPRKVSVTLTGPPPQ
jgi:hypothetical protein